MALQPQLDTRQQQLLINPAAGSRNSVGEALTNIIWAPLKNGIKSVSLSANWMWPANNIGENNRLGFTQLLKHAQIFVLNLVLMFQLERIQCL